MPRILVVEDSPTQAQLIHFTLDFEGFEVEIAPDGQRALDLLARTAFDVVVTDVVMPGLSGYELCRRIKAEERTRNTPVILLTSLADPMEIVQGLECGADSFLTKPCRADNLVARINDILANKTATERKAEIEVSFQGRKLTINANKEQILGLLISTFEDVVHANRELQASQAELAAARAQIAEYERRPGPLP